MRTLTALATLSMALTPRAWAQGGWVGPQAPCTVAGHFRVNTAVVSLKAAAEQPQHRDRMLRQTQEVLYRAIIADQQTRNSGAWYYLGRYFVEVKDGAGADSAFDRAEELAPQCKDDITGYRRRVWNDVMADGFRLWQEGKEDSALVAMRVAHGLLPNNPRSLAQIGAIYTNRDAPDSATWYFRKVVEVAGTDTAYAKERRDALASLARNGVRQVYGSPLVEQLRRNRWSRDSLDRVIANDSSVLSRIVSSSQARRARGGRLAPADQQRLTRDSTARAESVARGRQARGALASRVTADSAALAGIAGPAAVALRDYLREYPDAIEHATTLAGLSGLLGRQAEAAAVFDSVLARAGNVDAAALVDAGQRLVQANLFSAGIRALSAGLAKNPSHRDGLYTLANTYITTRDSTRAVDAARRLVQVDPMNRLSVRLLAGAWELKGTSDSVLKYVQIADSLLPVDVTVASFIPDSAGATLNLLVTNYHDTPSQAVRLVFEFVGGTGTVIATSPVDVPAMPAQGNQQFTIEPKGRGIAAWRYRSGP
jgi:cytochrome c-type biogenesis protein CcmH/NrfG